ncbi:hypothetical protein BJ878DRAFT_525146 [Calycina marina]|uniref:ATP-grasp domain-containing protein n=1 Tax=Calycina marina TaxID=1763456 RepID=A0A9P8CB81_9HELO|nr:hypothetical protein BJ878DRAFT_525146 [Calycina marina]
MILHAKFIVKHGTAEVNFDCSWETQAKSSLLKSAYFHSVDVILRVQKASTIEWLEFDDNDSLYQIFITTPSSDHPEEIKHHHFGDGSVLGFNFLLQSLKCSASAREGHQQAIKFIIPQAQGHMIRSDIFNLRLMDCPLISSVVSFCQPKRHFSSISKPEAVSNLAHCLNIFARSCAGILLLPSSNINSNLEILDLELETRLSFPWLSENARKRKTLAIVEGTKSPETGRNLFLAARSLDIAIIVLDRPGHWLEGPQYASWREAFLPMDRKPDTKFPDRIVEALQRYGENEGALKIDGLTTFFDPLFVGVAAAAEMLGLKTPSPEAYRIATDKFKTSVAEGHLAYRASSVNEAVRIAQESPDLSYPLIIKPCSGWGSEGVFRVDDEDGLKEAVEAIDFERHGNDIVIEEYCDGPEVDANFILADGELVFFEASDDFPKDADCQGASALKSFIEVANILPSALPTIEVMILKTSLHQSLLNLGFTDGFFHLEARVKDSSMEFQTDETSGLLDLKLKKLKLNASPSAWLIEINPRPPGVQALLASTRTYGIDYTGVSLCFAIQDKDAAKALSVPFQYSRVGNGAQYWCEIVFIPVIHGGIFESGDVCADLCKRRPDLAAHISQSHCFLQKGDSVKDPSSGLLNWIAYYLVFSHESRAQVLKLADSVRSETRFVVV